MLSVIKHMNASEHEQVVFCNDKNNGLKAIVALHNTKIGPTFGGCRMWNYKYEHDALYDVLIPSRGMTHKAAMSNINLGGGKAVIFSDSKKDAPDYVINARRLINFAHEIEVYNEEAALSQAEHSIYDNLIEVYKLSGSDRINTHEAAMKIANNRLNDLAKKNNLKSSNKDILDNSDNI